MLRIEARRQADAAWIVEALENHRVELKHDGGRWLVLVPDSGASSLLAEILGSLQSCVQDREIASVKVTIDDRTYVMEGVV